jgi:hypothetical protein
VKQQLRQQHHHPVLHAWKSPTVHSWQQPDKFCRLWWQQKRISSTHLLGWVNFEHHTTLGCVSSSCLAAVFGQFTIFVSLGEFCCCCCCCCCCRENAEARIWGRLGELQAEKRRRRASRQ